jgi:ribosomal protein S8
MSLTLIKALLTLKNASFLGKEYAFLDINIQYVKVLKILYREGFIQSIKKDYKILKYVIQLRFFEQRKIINNIKFFSTLSLKRFTSFSELCLINYKKTFILLSTSKGYLSLSQCKQLRIGGKLLFSIY